jgi:hypothetical protein
MAPRTRPKRIGEVSTETAGGWRFQDSFQMPVMEVVERLAPDISSRGRDWSARSLEIRCLAPRARRTKRSATWAAVLASLLVLITSSIAQAAFLSMTTARRNATVFAQHLAARAPYDMFNIRWCARITASRVSCRVKFAADRGATRVRCTGAITVYLVDGKLHHKRSAGGCSLIIADRF